MKFQELDATIAVLQKVVTPKTEDVSSFGKFENSHVFSNNLKSIGSLPQYNWRMPVSV